MGVSQTNTQFPFEYLEAAALGYVPNAGTNLKFGYNNAVGTTELTIINGATMVYAYPAAATIMQVSSTSTTDTSTGTGARVIYIEGLNASWAEISETVSMSGQTQVPTTNAYIRVNRSYITSVGSGDTNIGTIRIGTGTATAGVPGTTYAVLASGDGQSLQCIYSVPAGSLAILTHLQVTSARNTSTGSVTWRLMTRNYQEPFRCRVKFDTSAAGGSNTVEYSDSPVIFSSGADIEMRAVGQSSGNACSAQLSVNLVQAGLA